MNQKDRDIQVMLTALEILVGSLEQLLKKFDVPLDAAMAFGQSKRIVEEIRERYPARSKTT